MSCTDFNTLQQFWLNGQFFDGVFCAFGGPQSAMPASAFILMVGAALGVSIYTYTGSIAVPAVLAIILAGVVVMQLPGIALQLVGIILLIGIAAGGLLLIRRLR